MFPAITIMPGFFGGGFSVTGLRFKATMSGEADIYAWTVNDSKRIASGSGACNALLYCSINFENPFYVTAGYNPSIVLGVDTTNTGFSMAPFNASYGALNYDVVNSTYGVLPFSESSYPAKGSEKQIHDIVPLVASCSGGEIACSARSSCKQCLEFDRCVWCNGEFPQCGTLGNLPQSCNAVQTCAKES